MDGGVGSALDESRPPDVVARWVAINTHPHREHIAVENLQRQNFTVYCPSELKRIRHARRTQDVIRPLFPGYLFVAIVPERTLWRPILSTVGVRGIIRFGDRLAYVDDAFVAGLRAREVGGIIAKPVEPYRVGQHVRVNGGPFDGLIATIIDMDVKSRLTVLTDLLNQAVPVRVPATNVRAL